METAIKGRHIASEISTNTYHPCAIELYVSGPDTLSRKTGKSDALSGHASGRVDVATDSTPGLALMELVIVATRLGTHLKTISPKNPKAETNESLRAGSPFMGIVYPVKLPRAFCFAEFHRVYRVKLIVSAYYFTGMPLRGGNFDILSDSKECIFSSVRRDNLESDRKGGSLALHIARWNRDGRDSR